MLRAIFAILMLVSAAGLYGCGDDCGGLCGSACDNISCAFNTIECDRYLSTDPPAIKIMYEQIGDTGGRIYTAIISCDLAGIDKVEGKKFEGQEFLDRCTIYRPEPPSWPDFDGNFCEFSSGGDTAGDMSGKCAFAFNQENLRFFLTANFSCDAEII